MKNFIFTCGDINGIGPEIVIKSLNKIFKRKDSVFTFICPRNVFEFYSKLTSPEFDFYFSNDLQSIKKNSVKILELGYAKISLAKPSKTSGRISFEAICTAANACLSNKYSAMITAPISKESFNEAGIKFPGHTELLADITKQKNFVMMFLSQKMKAALLTIHIPISKVPSVITRKLLSSKLETIIKSLNEDFNIFNPKIAILGLNPHAGENGIIGKEEKNIITPFIKSSALKQNLFGPFSADAFFANNNFKKYDLILAMYHDQALIPFKMMNFNSGVNYTAGLPIIRTSPDHGTAFDIAGKNTANEISMLQAFHFANRILNNRLSNG